VKADHLLERLRMKVRTHDLLEEQREKVAAEAVENFSVLKKKKRVSK